MPAAKYDLKIEQGADFKESLVLTNSEGGVLNLTGYTAKMQIRPYVSSDVVLIDATDTNGILVISALLGKIEINLTEVQTSTLIYTKSVFDLFITDSSGTTTKILEGNITVSPSVTRG